MKWNWGTTIALVIILFLAIMAGMVYVAMRQTNEMMDANYYEKEIQYQQLIDASRRYEQLPQDSLLKVAPDHIAIYIPTAQLQDFRGGELELLHLNDGAADHKIALQPDAAGLCLIPLNALKNGSYKMRLSWTAAGEKYYKDQEIQIWN